MNTEVNSGTTWRGAEGFPVVEPWPEAVEGKALLDELEGVVRRFVVLPKWAPETLALWVAHTYAFELRDVSTYLGIESPEKRCGKTTLLTVLGELVNRPVVASNISSPAFFRVIQQERPTLLIDEADTFLQGNDELRGILNSGYTRKTAYVWRVVSEVRSAECGMRNEEGGGRNGEYGVRSGTGSEQSVASGRSEERGEGGCRAARFSSWCPKVLAAIGRLPETLADRCIVMRMQRKLETEKCDSVRSLEGQELRRKCVRFVRDQAGAIASARPELPKGLNDRAGDIWEPLLALADLGGPEWGERARSAAVGLSAGAEESSTMGELLFDMSTVFVNSAHEGRVFSREMVAGLNGELGDRAWKEGLKGGKATEVWLAGQLRRFGLGPKTMRINAERAKGYLLDDFREALLRYASRADIRALRKDVEEARALRNKAAGAAGGGVKVSQNSPQAQSEFCLPPGGT